MHTTNVYCQKQSSGSVLLKKVFQKISQNSQGLMPATITKFLVSFLQNTSGGCCCIIYFKRSVIAIYMNSNFFQSTAVKPWLKKCSVGITRTEIISRCKLYKLHAFVFAFVSSSSCSSIWYNSYQPNQMLQAVPPYTHTLTHTHTHTHTHIYIFLLCI